MDSFIDAGRVKAEQLLGETDQTLQSGEDALTDVLVYLHDTAHQTLDAGFDAINSVTDHLAGAADLALDSAVEFMSKPVNYLISRAADPLSTGEDALRNNGWRYPYAPADVAQALEMGADTVVPYMVPELAALVRSPGTDAAPTGQGPPTNVACASNQVYDRIGTDAAGNPVMGCVDIAPSPPTAPLPPSPPPPDGACLGPGGLPWVDSPEGQALFKMYSAQPLGVSSFIAGDPPCQYWVKLVLGVPTNQLPPFAVGPCIGADGSPYGYYDVCGTSPPTAPPIPPVVPPIVPPVIPPVVPPVVPPVSPPPPPGECCPPANITCPPPTVEVTVNVPPIVFPPYPPYPVPPAAPPPPPTEPPTTPPPPTAPPSPPVAPPVPPIPPILPPLPPKTVPPPSYITPPPTPGDRPYMFDWWYDDACTRLESEFTGITSIGGKGTITTSEGESDIPTLLSWLSDQLTGEVVNPIENAILDVIPAGIGTAMDGLIGIGIRMANKFIGRMPITHSNHIDRLLKLGTSLAISGWAERVSGAPIQYLNTDTLYAWRYESPQYIPGQGELDELYIRGYLTSEVYECLTRAHGNIPTWRQQIAYMRQMRPTPPELNKLVLNSRIDTPTWRQEMRKWGFADDDDANRSFYASANTLDLRSVIDASRRDMIDQDEFNKLSFASGFVDTRLVELQTRLMDFIPPYTDIIRMMVHDVEDDSVVSDYNLDSDFANKYKGTLARWGRWQGIPHDAALYMWRSHWTYPSPTQTYQFLHRLRADRPERVEWESQNPRDHDESEYQYHNRGPIAFTVKDARRLLSVNDMAPTFIDAEIAISYQPITRTDAIRAFEIGVYDESQLKWNFIFNGYSDDDADKLVAFEREQKSRRVANATGVLTIRKIVKYYKGGALKRSDAEHALQPLMVNPADRQLILDRADREMSAETRTRRLMWVKRQYRYGAIADADLYNTLIGLELDKYTADQLTSQWIYDRRIQAKEPTALMLCKWFNHKLLSQDDYFVRLQRIGYSYEDAAKIMAVCVQDMLMKEKNAAEKKAEKERKELEKALKSAFQLQQANQKQLEKWIANLKKQMEAAQKALDAKGTSSAQP